MPSILVVEEDTMTRALTARALASVAGVTVLAACSVREARAVIGVSRPDAALVEMTLEDGLGFDVLEALDERGGVAMALFPSAHVEPAAAGVPAALSRLQFLSRPLDHDLLRQIVQLWSVPGELFNGPFAPIEYVQIALHGVASVVLHCSDPGGGALGSIVMHDGRVWSARTRTLSGEAALRELVVRPDARVHVEALAGDVGPADIELDVESARSAAPPASRSYARG